MKRISLAIGAAALLLSLSACVPAGNAPTAKQTQTAKAEAAAESIHFDQNAEIDNIQKRLTLTADPGLIGYVVLLNQMGQPVMYTGVKGKITSGGKRLTRSDEWVCRTNEGCNIREAASDEGTFGHSGEYVYFWTPEGQYIQWNGGYLYSDKPFRLSAEPIVISEVK